MKKKIISSFILSSFLIGLCFSANVNADNTIPPDPFIVESTAYYNPNENKTADGSDTISNFTLAGRTEWLGYTAVMYEVNEDGSIGNFIGYYEFHDTGYGKDGDIQRGETIDIYMNTKQECVDYGRKKVWIKLIKAEG